MSEKRTAASSKAGYFILLEDCGGNRRGKVLWLEPDAIKKLDGKIRRATDLEKSIAAIGG